MIRFYDSHSDGVRIFRFQKIWLLMMDAWLGQKNVKDFCVEVHHRDAGRTVKTYFTRFDGVEFLREGKKSYEHVGKRVRECRFVILKLYGVQPETQLGVYAEFMVDIGQIRREDQPWKARNVTFSPFPLGGYSRPMLITMSSEWQDTFIRLARIALQNEEITNEDLAIRFCGILESGEARRLYIDEFIKFGFLARKKGGYKALRTWKGFQEIFGYNYPD